MTPTTPSRTLPVRVLVVDDNAAIRCVMSVALSVEDGVGEVRVAASGEEALRIAGEWAPDVIVLDYWMPVMDGEAVAAHLRDMHPGARIVAFSGVLDAKPGWADDHFVKGELPDLQLVISLDD